MKSPAFLAMASRDRTVKWGLIAERAYPYVLGVIVGVIYYYCRSRLPAARNPTDLLAALVNVSAIAVGFLATAQSVLLSIEGRTVMKRLKEQGYDKRLFGYLSTSISLGFVLAVVSALALIVDFDVPARWHQVAVAAWAALVVMSLMTWFRIARLFAKILRSG